MTPDAGADSNHDGDYGGHGDQFADRGHDVLDDDDDDDGDGGVDDARGDDEKDCDD